MTQKNSTDHTKTDLKETSSDENADTDTSDSTDDGGDLPTEYGGTNKPEPTRYGDWEVDGRCTDF